MSDEKQRRPLDLCTSLILTYSVGYSGFIGMGVVALWVAMVTTCASEGHHPHRHQVNEVGLSGGELCQPHIEHADEDQGPQRQDVS